MFDRTACPDPGLLALQPYVSIEALAALSALLDLALKDQAPPAVLLSGASRGAALVALGYDAIWSFWDRERRCRDEIHRPPTNSQAR
jgi:hypothetical protein